MRKYFSSYNLYRFLLGCFVISLCIFHGKVFGTGFIRNTSSDFLTKQLYLADLLIALLLVFALTYKRFSRINSLGLILISLALWSIIPRGTNYNYYAILRLIECLACFWIFFHVKDKVSIYKIVSVLGSIESIIGIIQFHLKHSFGLHVLGEPVFNTMTDGIAKIDLSNGLKVVRAYGTFSHPNSLGAFLVIALAFTIYLIFSQKRTWPYYLSFLFILTGITVTFSRGAILTESVLIIGVIINLLAKKVLKSKELAVFLGVLALGIIISSVSYGTYLSKRATVEDNSTSLRIQYDKEGLEIGEHHALFGVGYGNVIYSMNNLIPINQPSWMIQPPHNYLIIVSDETGLIGLGLFMAFLGYIFSAFIKRFKESVETEQGIETIIMFWLFISLIVLMQFDHYFYDIPLMALLFWMTLGIISGVADSKKIQGPMVQW